MKKLASLLLSLMIFATLSAYTAFADDRIMSTLTVEANAVIKTIPDIAYVTFSIKTLNYDAILSQEENKIKSDSIYSKLHALSVDNKNIKTQSYTIKPVYDTKRIEEKTEVYIDGKIEYKTEYKNESVLKGYETINAIIVTVNEVDMDVSFVGKIIDLSISNGANQANGVSFVLSDEKREKIYIEALDEASKRVNDKAQTVASRLGITSLKPVTVNIENAHVNVSSPAVYPSSGGIGGGGVSNSGSDEMIIEEIYTPISPGETSVSAKVSVIFTY